jgi:hypothetical protein
MAALTASKKIPQFGAGNTMVLGLSLPMKASTRIFSGALVGIDSSGNAMPAGLLAGGTVRVLGVADAEVDNTSGAAAAKSVPVRRGAFSFKNSSAGDAITKADVGAPVYVVDDQTVAKTNGTSTRALAGICIGLDDNGSDVIVEVGVHLS